MKANYTVIFGIIFLIFLAGIIVRITGGIPLISSISIINSAGSNDKSDSVNPEDTAKQFYISLSEADYRKAWEASIEPDWVSGKDVRFKDEVATAFSCELRLTGEKEFADRMNNELGGYGAKLKISNIESRPLDVKIDTESKKIIDLLNPDKIMKAEVTGNILTACTIYRWNKDVYVLKIKDKYKVLLSGTKSSKSHFYSSWFTNIEKVGTLRENKGS